MTMSCPEVVYQAYYPYLYQRPSTSASAVARTTPFPPFSHQYDRFNVQRSLEHQQQPSSSASSLPPSIDVYHAHHSSHHSSAGSVSSGGGGVGSPGSPPVSVLRHKEEDAAAGGSSGEGGPPGLEEDEDDDEETGGTTGPGSRAQYVSANCVVFTHYSGDVASVVDEHFSRALSYAENKSNSSTSTQVKETSPMSARNFPPSFWNSNYQASPAAVTSHHSAAAELYGDPYHPHSAATAASDPWHSHYQQYSAAAAHHHHRAVHEYHHHHNMAAQYGGLLLPPTTRLPPHVTASHQYSKGAVPEPWGAASHSAAAAAARLHHDQASAHHSHAHTLDSAGYSAYPTMADWLWCPPILLSNGDRWRFPRE
ncbi:protein vestigial isoform X2 [Cryptotermes secundus]|uniref:protein vestigial isoform X2 n=1 Tax=Cryptotermes secundus TaxID=105785 RepID=UPI000CD7D758|nr:protein vestigial isoform X2 [Cryptotermes secundus]